MITAGDNPENPGNRAPKPKAGPGDLTESAVRKIERRSFVRQKLGHHFVGDSLRRLIDLQVENIPRWRFPR